jgi:fatty acid desaturase
MHVVRLAIAVAALALACSPWLLAQIPLPFPLALALPAAASAWLFFTTFSFFHDCAHGALELPTVVNDIILFCTSAPLLMSAHGQRQLHLRHHAHPLAPDDMEGEGALAALPIAVLLGPIASFRMRAASVLAVNARVRPWVIAENFLNALVVALVLWSQSPALIAALAVSALLQLTMNAWASHVPHRAPQWLLHFAAKLSWTHSPVVLSLVYHLEHHAHPRVPCMLLKPDLPLASPLLEHALPWPQLQLASRPRPRTRV